MDVAREVIYVAIVIVLALLLYSVGMQNQENRVTIDRLQGEVAQIKVLLDADGKATHLLRSLKQQGIDPKLLGNGVR